MSICFVMQPFDASIFDKRYDDVFAPAIRAAGLEPYRVDQDPKVNIPIEDIQTGIRNADICLAEITTDNPNVWFELGYAIASQKEVVLVCSDERNSKFPFDVQHRNITKYRTESTRDFNQLREKITERLKAIIGKMEAIGNVANLSPIAETEGLEQYEIVTLVTIAENADTPSDRVYIYTIRQDMTRAGYTRIAVSIGLTSLIRKGMIESVTETDRNGNETTVYFVLPKGMDWLFTNREWLVLKQTKPDAMGESGFEDDIPF
jgi:nucleoside 2-deoxyribosyltransferase